MSEVGGSDVWAVVLAGGSGMRLEGFVRQALGSQRPKQFSRIIGTRSMLRHTWDRAARVVDSHHMVTVITAGHETYLAEESANGIPGKILVQPENRDTAPGLLVALLWIARHDPAAKVVVYPADHFVWEEDRFAACVATAVAASGRVGNRLVLLGVEAEGPDTGYGWIAPGDPLPTCGSGELYAVRRFWEKPDLPTAARLLACGYLWNTLVLAGDLQGYLGLAAAGMPQVLDRLRRAAETFGTRAEAAALACAYARIPPLNLSHALLARYPAGLAVLPVRDVCWSDWGDADRIVHTLRRFGRRPSWLPAYVSAQMHATASAAPLSP